MTIQLNFRIAVIGLGYVGLPLVLSLAKNFSTLGFDTDGSRINDLERFWDKTGEVDEEKIKHAFDQGLCLKSNDDAVSSFAPEIFIITVPTPVNEFNNPDFSALIRACELVGRSIKKNGIVVFESTVYPGATEEVCIPIIEQVANLKARIDFHYGYSPERINPGDQLHALHNTNKVLAASDEETLSVLREIYSKIVTDAEVYLASSVKVAEAAKVIENTQRDVNIAFVNELVIIFDKLGISTSEVLAAARTKWNFLDFRPGLVGGHCIGVDPYYLIHKAHNVGYSPLIIGSGRYVNDQMHLFIKNKILDYVIDQKADLSSLSIGILGITFKENCSDVRNSKAIDLAQAFVDLKIEVGINDPFVDKSYLPNHNFSSFDELYNYNVIILAVTHHQFLELNLNDLRKKCADSFPPLFFDVKSVYNEKVVQKAGFKYMSL